MSAQADQSTESFTTLQAEWNRLLQRSATDTLFLTWEWQRAWWEIFGQDKELVLITNRDESDQLTAIVPLFGQDTLVDPDAALPEISIENPEAASGANLLRTMHFVGGSEVSDYLDIISPRENNHAACAYLLDSLAEREDWQILDLRNIPSASPTVASLIEQASLRGWQVEAAPEDVCPILELPGSWDDFLATRLDKKRRHELRRKMRRAERETDVGWDWIGGHDFDDGVQVFLELHRASDPEKSAFMSARMESFFRKIAHVAQEQGWLRLAILRFDGHPVASYLCFDYHSERLVYNSGFDVSTYGQLSPGIVLLGYLVEDAIRSRCSRVDFLQGNERYKYDLGAIDSQVTRVLVHR